MLILCWIEVGGRDRGRRSHIVIGQERHPVIFQDYDKSKRVEIDN